MTHRSRSTVALVLLYAVLATACAPGILGAKQTVANAQVIGAETLRQFQVADAAYQDKVVAEARAANDTKIAREKLAAYWWVRSKVLVAENAFNVAVQAALEAIRTVEAGGKVDFVALATKAMAAAMGLKAAIEQVTTTTTVEAVQ